MNNIISVNQESRTTTFEHRDIGLVELTQAFGEEPGRIVFDVDPLHERAVYYVPVRIEEPIANMINGSPFATEQYLRVVTTSKAEAVRLITKRLAIKQRRGCKVSILSTDRIFKKEI